MDVDIDIPPKTDVQKLFRTAIRGSAVDKETKDLVPHNVGYYFQDIPVDAITGLSAIPFNNTEECGYMKIDMLNVNLLSKFDSKAEMRRLAKLEPNWSLLEDKKVVKTLFHLGKHFDVISKVKPRSIQEIADVFALIRPNKRPLLDKYIKDPEKWRKELFTKRSPKDMRKAHAIPYAIMIVCQLHLIEQGRA